MNKRRIDIAKKKKTGKWLKLIIKVFTLVILLTLAIGIFYFYNTYGKILIKLQKEAKLLVHSSTEEIFKSSQTSLVYDNDGKLITSLKGVKDVYYIEYKDIPPVLLNAIIVTEDKKFLVMVGLIIWQISVLP